MSAENLARARMYEVAKMSVVVLLFLIVYAITYYLTRMTPEREAALKAEGAASFDAEVERAGGLEKWIAEELAEAR